MKAALARFALGQIVRHRDAAFRGVVVDVDPEYAGDPGDTGAISPKQPFYRVLVPADDGGFLAYAPEDQLEHDPDIAPISSLDERRWFTVDARGHHAPRSQAIH